MSHRFVTNISAWQFSKKLNKILLTEFPDRFNLGYIPNGFLTTINFENETDLIVFKLKYGHVYGV
jgi:hypothetical protein